MRSANSQGEGRTVGVRNSITEDASVSGAGFKGIDSVVKNLIILFAFRIKSYCSLYMSYKNVLLL